MTNKRKATRALLAMFFAMGIASVVGCELIVDFDRQKIDAGAAEDGAVSEAGDDDDGGDEPEEDAGETHDASDGGDLPDADGDDASDDGSIP